MFSNKKPYSAVTVTVERLTSEQFEEDDVSGIPDLVEVIKLQSTGPQEAARALRKKLKYGNVHRQLRALTLLDGLLQNAGARFQRTFVDEPLLERLRFCGTSELTDKEVRDRCRILFAQWSHEYKTTPGLAAVAALHKELPRRKKEVTQERSKVLRETEADPFDDEGDEEAHAQSAGASTSRLAPKVESSTPTVAAGKKVVTPAGFDNSFFETSTTSKKSKKDKKSSKSKRRSFNLEEEKGKMKTAIAESSVASINLLNALQLINREHERVSQNATAAQRFETCKMLRRHILRYIQYVESEQWLGALIHANDELVTALMTFEQLDHSIDADSDSEDELAEQAHLYRMAAGKGKEMPDAAASLAGLSINPPSHRPTPPPRPVAQSEPVEDEVEDDENDPFGDSNAVQTPAVERGPPTWRVV